MLFNNRVQVTVSKIDRPNDRVWLHYQNDNGELIEKELSFKSFVTMINSDPDVKILKPIIN